MRETSHHGVLVVGHGSRRQEANEDVLGVARKIAERGSFDLVEAAFLELEHPNISEGFARLVQRGAREITVHPYFLSPGRHTRGDIPVEVERAASRYPAVSYRITEPLAAHRLVIEASIERIRETAGLHPADERRGTVYLVGAGPGDPGLLTIKALDLLRNCDVVVYDYLVNPDLLLHLSAHAERIYVGKVGGRQQTPQHEINRLLIESARANKIVVRLKGGDPFLFGRGAEEALALRDAGLPFEIVPGVSSALAVPAYAGIPLTHRGFSSSVAFVTGTQGGAGNTSPALRNVAGAETIVILMGVAHLHQIALDLISFGRAADTPVAVIRWGTYEAQLTIVGTLRNIAAEAEKAGLRAPAVIVVGDVVLLRENLQWFEAGFGGIVFEEDAAAKSVFIAS